MSQIQSYKGTGPLKQFAHQKSRVSSSLLLRVRITWSPGSPLEAENCFCFSLNLSCSNIVASHSLITKDVEHLCMLTEWSNFFIVFIWIGFFLII